MPEVADVIGGAVADHDLELEVLRRAHDALGEWTEQLPKSSAWRLAFRVCQDEIASVIRPSSKPAATQRRQGERRQKDRRAEPAEQPHAQPELRALRNPRA